MTHLISVAPSIIKPRIEQELRNLRAGVKGEADAAYLINFDLRESKNTLVIHDLRLEVKGRVAQIDHLLIHRTMNIYVVESKHFHAGIKITDEGDFMQWNAFKKTYEGIASPLAQNERHISVLKDIFEYLIDLPVRLGIKLNPEFHSLVAVDSKSRIDRPKKFDTSSVIKADVLIKKLEDDRQQASLLGTLAKLLGDEALLDLGQQLVKLHRPIQFDYSAKFGISKPEDSATQIKKSSIPVEVKSAHEFKCRTCGNSKVSIQYGKFGYYFKCEACEGNTPIKLGCGMDGHKERLRKDGKDFYRECPDCKSSSLFYSND